KENMRRTTLIAGIPIAGIVALSHQQAAAWSPSTTFSRGAPTTTRLASSSISIESLNLTPELAMMTDAFASIPDEKTRHKQLLYMASKLPDVDDSVRVPENKVPGCLSTVHVDCTVEENDDGRKVVQYFGDSDGLLTKGLLALLIRGLSGCTPEEINAIDPQFVKAAKISQTLTPGRNNGFLNMLAVMKKKAFEAVERENGGDVAVAVSGEEQSTENETAEVVTSFEEIEGKPMYNAIMSTLITVLKPTSITLVDNSSQHAGHAGSKGWAESGESHFALEVVAEAFEGLSLVKRHQLIYMLLGETMPKIHALEIKAKSPSEV
ncbi:hypothetical protein ACHAXN_011226, partial [Cyclotella atomus]